MSENKKQQAQTGVKEIENVAEASAELTKELAEVIEEIAETPEKKTPKKGEVVTLIDAENFLIGDRPYRIVQDYRDAFDPERLGERYSEVLSRYDYIVADWGYEQLRLKGFFSDENRKVPVEMRIGTLEDYLYEFCNFGCSYFVIERTGARKEKQQNRNKRKKQHNKKPQAHVEEKKGSVEPKKKPATQKAAPVVKQKNEQAHKPVIKTKRAVAEKPKEPREKKESTRHFTIRKKTE